MLILRALPFGPRLGHGIARFIQQSSDEVLAVEHGSLSPALHRLERDGWIVLRWEVLPGETRELTRHRIFPRSGASFGRRRTPGTKS